MPCAFGVTVTEYEPSAYETVAIASMKLASGGLLAVVALTNETGSAYSLPATSLKPSAVVTV